MEQPGMAPQEETDVSKLDHQISIVKSTIETFDKAGEQQKEQLNEALNNELDVIANKLIDDPTFCTSLCTLLNGYENKEGDEIYDSLKRLAVKVWLEEKGGSWSKKTSEQLDVQWEKPIYQLKWNLEGIRELETNEKRPSLWKGVLKDKPEWPEPDDINLKLYSTKDVVENLSKDVSVLLSKNLENKNELEEINTFLEGILKIIDINVTSNVKILQKFISDNLPENLKTKFDSNNQKQWEFDWTFWRSTVEYLNIVVKFIREYVDKVEERVNHKGDKPTQTETVEWTDEKADTSTPLNFNNKYYPVISDAPKIQWVTFYSLVWGDTPDSKTPTKLEIKPWEEKECLMHSNGSTYKVKIANDVYNGKSVLNLNPVAENMSSHVKVLLNNVPQCMDYLAKRAPTWATIGWNKRLQDYTITSYGMTLTVEPMTMEWKWFNEGEDLSQCLELLNFTNFLRGSGVIPNNDLYFDKNKPQIKLDGNNICIKLKKGEKYEWKEEFPYSKDNFLTKDDKVWKKFIKYINNQEWNQNWDSKAENNYKKINVVGWKIVSGGGTSSPFFNMGAVGAVIPSWVGLENSWTGNAENLKIADDLQLSLGIVSLNQDKIWEICKEYSIPENTPIYHSRDDRTKYYYKDNDNKIFCVWHEKEKDWCKWVVDAQTNNPGEVVVNPCEAWKNLLNSILNKSLNDLWIDADKVENISIDLGKDWYIFNNWGKKFHVNDDVLKDLETNNFLWWTKNFSINEKLKILYLASEYIPWDFKLVGEDIVSSVDWGEEKKIPWADLIKYWIDDKEEHIVDVKNWLINYLNGIKVEE